MQSNNVLPRQLARARELLGPSGNCQWFELPLKLLHIVKTTVPEQFTLGFNFLLPKSETVTVVCPAAPPAPGVGL